MNWTRSLSVRLVVAIVAAYEAAVAQPVCVGDCDRGGSVAVSEVVHCVAIALSTQPLASCDGADGNGDGQVGIEELTQSVLHALEGCGLPDGAECIFRSECRSRNCIDNICCNEECAMGRCTRPDRFGICTPLADIGDQCTTDLDCRSEVCDPLGICCAYDCGIPCGPDGYCLLPR
jgi:hypothetical protein